MGHLGARKENEAEGGASQRLPDEAIGQWLIWANDVGEELAAEALVEEVGVMLFGKPRKRGLRQIETRLWNLIESAEREAKHDTGPRPIPGALHYTLAKLLDWLGEIDGVRGKPRLSAFVLFESQDQVAFGGIGGNEPRVIANGEPIEVDWQQVTDRRGRDARGFAMFARSDLRLQIEWSTSLPGRENQPLTIRAEWRGADVALGEATPELRLHEPSPRAIATHSAPDSEPPAAEQLVNNEEEWVSRSEDQASDLIEDQMDEHQVFDSYEDQASYEDSTADSYQDQAPGPSEEEASTPSQGPRIQPIPTSAVEPRIPSLTAWVPEIEDPTLAGVTPSTVGQGEGFFQWLDRVVAHRRQGEGSVEAPPATGEAASEVSPTAGDQGSGKAEEPIRVVHGPVPIETREAPGPVSIPHMTPESRREPPAETPAKPATVHPKVAAVPPERVPAAPAPGRPAPVHTRAAVVPAEHASGAPAPQRPAPVEVEPAPSPPRPALVERVVETPEGEAPVEVRWASDVDVDSGERTLDAPEEARPAGPRSVPGRTPRRPAWPAPAERERQPHRLVKILPTALVVAVLFAGGWLLGRQASNAEREAGPSSVLRVLRGVGLAAPRFECKVTSVPAGALIAVDGKNINRRTPATLELTPGQHALSLTLPEFGSASFDVKGARGERVPLEANLSGSLTVRPADARRSIQVTIDGADRGVAPVTIQELAPGYHELRFSAPGVTPWGHTVRVGIREESEIVARPFQSATTGLLDIRAVLNDENGAQAVQGAAVWVDGRRRGVAPVTLELPAGPHSIRVQYRDEQAPVQVIDLPGGNQRFASFQFGIGAEAPQLLLLSSSAPLPRNRPSVLSSALEGITAAEVREMWLHVKNPEGVWRRYPMVQLEGPGAVVGVAVFPLALLDNKGRAPYYVSASTTLGDEYFSEIENTEPLPGPSPEPARPSARVAPPAHVRPAAASQPTSPPVPDQH